MSLYVPNDGNQKDFIAHYGGTTSSTKLKHFSAMKEAFFYVNALPEPNKGKKKDQKNLATHQTPHDVFLCAPFGKYKKQTAELQLISAQEQPCKAKELKSKTPLALKR